MPTIRDVMINALQENKFKMKSLNRNLMEISMSNKKRVGFVKVAVDDQFATNLMERKDIAFILYMNGDEFNEMVDSMEDDDERPKGSDGICEVCQDSEEEENSYKNDCPHDNTFTYNHGYHKVCLICGEEL